MNHWIIPCNPSLYDAYGAFHNLKTVYWTQKLSSVKIGDIVYIYLSHPIHQVVFKCEIMAVNVPFCSDVLNDKPYWKGNACFDTKVLIRKYMELKLIAENTTERLNLWDLRNQGEKSNFQGGKKIVDIDYLNFVESIFL